MILPTENIPVMSAVSAGTLSPDDMWGTNGYRTVRLLKRRHTNDKFAASRVNGNCLSDVGIFDGDWVLFRFTCEAELGQCVVVATPYGQTVKYFFPRSDGTLDLCTDANGQDVSSTWLQEDVRIQGVVVRFEQDK